jgi:hypothetical protein
MKRHETTSAGGTETAPITSLQNFCRGADISPITAWRLRRKGWLETININGRQYVTAEAVAEFKRRAAAGEFSKVHKTPSIRVTSPVMA